ncbi:MAG: hypothetical protein V1799_11755 [bacterium]
MPTIDLHDFINQLHSQFPKLKNYDETRILSILMEAGMNVEFEFDADGNTLVKYDDMTPEIKEKLVHI